MGKEGGHVSVLSVWSSACCALFHYLLLQLGQLVAQGDEELPVALKGWDG